MHAFDVLGDPVRRRILELLAQGEQASGEIRLYYGAADTSICLATAHIDDLLDAIEPATAS